MRDNFLKALAKCLFLRTGSVRGVAFGPLRGMRYRVGEITGLSPWYSGADREHQKAFKQLVGEGDTAVDVGANWGLHVLYLSKLVGPRGLVVAVEPFAAAMRELEWHLRANQCSNVKALSLALSDRDGQASFTPGHSSSTGHLSSLASGASGGGVTGSEVVRTRTLDSIVEELDPDTEAREDRRGGGRKHAGSLTTHGYTLERLSPGPAIRNVQKGWPDPEGVWGTILGRPAARADVQRPISRAATDLNRGQ